MPESDYAKIAGHMECKTRSRSLKLSAGVCRVPGVNADELLRKIPQQAL